MNRIRLLLGTLWRGIAVGMGYFFALLLASILFGVLGLLTPASGAVAVRLLWMVLASILLGLFLGPVAARTSASQRQHVLVWTAVIFFNMGAVALEGAYFAPELVPIPIPLLAIQQFIAALVAGVLIALLIARRGQTAAFLATLRRRSWFAWVWRFLIASLSYLVFYLVFGALNYSLVTEPYYTTHAGGLLAPDAATVLRVELIRAPLLVLSIVLFILASHTTRRRSLINTGLILFWVGGVVPLVLQIGMLPAQLLVASAAEIFLQNFLTGVVTASLFWTSQTADKPTISDCAQLHPTPA